MHYRQTHGDKRFSRLSAVVVSLSTRRRTRKYRILCIHRVDPRLPSPRTCIAWLCSAGEGAIIVYIICEVQVFDYSYAVMHLLPQLLYLFKKGFNARFINTHIAMQILHCLANTILHPQPIYSEIILTQRKSGFFHCNENLLLRSFCTYNYFLVSQVDAISRTLF